MCCQKLVIAQKYSAEVWPNFSTRLAPSAKTSVSHEHYKGIIRAEHYKCTSTVECPTQSLEMSLTYDTRCNIFRVCDSL